MQRTCKDCGKEISGRPVPFQDFYLCTSCFRKRMGVAEERVIVGQAKSKRSDLNLEGATLTIRNEELTEKDIKQIKKYAKQIIRKIKGDPTR